MSRDVLVSPFSHHRNGDASHVDRDPYTQLRAAKHQGNPIRVSQPRDAYSSRDGTTSSDRDIVAGQITGINKPGLNIGQPGTRPPCLFALHLRPDLDQAADGFGARWLVLPLGSVRAGDRAEGARSVRSNDGSVAVALVAALAAALWQGLL